MDVREMNYTCTIYMTVQKFSVSKDYYVIFWGKEFQINAVLLNFLLNKESWKKCISVSIKLSSAVE